MENGQTSLLDILPRDKGGRKTTKLIIPSNYGGLLPESKDIYPAYRWYARMKRLRNEMFSANITEAKSTYMEQIRSEIRTSRIATLWKMRSLHKPQDTGMDIQTRQ